MKPAEYPKDGANQSIRYGYGESYLGWVSVALTERGVCFIDLDDSPEILKTRLENNFPTAILGADDPVVNSTLSETLSFLENPEIGFDLSLDIQGTAFQQRVWAALRDIQPGLTASYTEIAKQIGKPKAARAVARACASNIIAAAIPCHRVVRSNGDLGGYRWGLERKKMLLERESR